MNITTCNFTDASGPKTARNWASDRVSTPGSSSCLTT